MLGAGCSEPESFIVLSLRTTNPTPIDNVAQIQVQVSGSRSRTLVYEAHGMSINQTEVKTLSVGFSHGETGNVTFTVDLLNNLGCSIGNGKVTQEIKKGNTVEATVSLAAGLDCSIADGGTPEVPPGSTLPGCDPVNPQAPDGGSGNDAGSAADGGVLSCTSTQTCQVDCTPPNNAAPRNECVPGGTGAPGTACNTNADCQPGTQCFNYTSTGCAVKLCLRFCNTNAGLRRLRRERRRARQLLRGPGDVSGVPDRVPHLHVQLRSARDGRGRTRRLPGGPRLRDAGGDGRGRLRLPRGDAHQAGRRGLHAGRRLRPGPDLQPDVGHEDLPPDLPLRRQRRGHLHRDGE